MLLHVYSPLADVFAGYPTAFLTDGNAVGRGDGGVQVRIRREAISSCSRSSGFLLTTQATEASTCPGTRLSRDTPALRHSRLESSD